MKRSELPSQVDLAPGHVLRWVTTKDDEVMGAEETHLAAHDYTAGGVTIPAGEPCSGFIHFDVPYYDAGVPRWQVESWNPLTISPSVLCRVCGNHGFIREGKWVPA